MPTTRVDHTETWTIHIERDETDRWPDIEFNHRSGRSRTLRPDSISVLLRRGASQPSVTVHGPWLKKNGEPGTGPAATVYSFPGRREWVDEIAERTRQRMDLGPGRTEVPW